MNKILYLLGGLKFIFDMFKDKTFNEELLMIFVDKYVIGEVRTVYFT